MQFYPADWRKDPGVQALDFHDRGVWFEILCIMHESSERGVLLLNGQPMPEPALARLLGLDNQTLNQTLTNLLTYGVASRRQEDGALYSRRMVKDENLCQVRREAGKKGGNPHLVNQKFKQKSTTGVNQIPTPSSSTSSTTSTNVDATACAQDGGELATPVLPISLAGDEAEGGAARPAREMPADEAPVFTSAGLRAFAARMAYAHIDVGHYLTRIQRKAEHLSARSAEGWENYVLAWLDRDRAAGKLVLLISSASVQAQVVAVPRFGQPQPTPATTGYDLMARAKAQKTEVYL